MSADTPVGTLDPIRTQLTPDEQFVYALAQHERLGYLAPSDEWTDGRGVPLGDSTQIAAHRLWRNGLLPEFQDCGLPEEFVAPNACAWCDIGEREHYGRYKAGPGWHEWTAPTDALRLARMRARHAKETDRG